MRWSHSRPGTKRSHGPDAAAVVFSRLLLLVMMQLQGILLVTPSSFSGSGNGGGGPRNWGKCAEQRRSLGRSPMRCRSSMTAAARVLMVMLVVVVVLSQRQAGRPQPVVLLHPHVAVAVVIVAVGIVAVVIVAAAPTAGATPTFRTAAAAAGTAPPLCTAAITPIALIGPGGAQVQVGGCAFFVPRGMVHLGRRRVTQRASTAIRAVVAVAAAAPTTAAAAVVELKPGCSLAARAATSGTSVERVVSSPSIVAPSSPSPRVIISGATSTLLGTDARLPALATAAAAASGWL